MQRLLDAEAAKYRGCSQLILTYPLKYLEFNEVFVFR